MVSEQAMTLINKHVKQENLLRKPSSEGTLNFSTSGIKPKGDIIRAF